jgi:hypothetical protein
MYKLNENSIQRLSDNASIPQAEGNRDYQQFLQDVKVNGLTIVEGADVIEPDYVALRTGVDGYTSTGEQLGMIADGTQEAHVAEVKAKFPKTITGGTTIADVPAWVKTEVAKVLFAEQLQAYKVATARLEVYVLADGRPELTEMQDTTEYVVDAEGMLVLTDGEPTFIQEEVIVQTAIEPLPATVEQTTYDDEGNATVTDIENPLIAQDNLERTDAQAVVDATPQTVKDAA